MLFSPDSSDGTEPDGRPHSGSGRHCDRGAGRDRGAGCDRDLARSRLAAGPLAVVPMAVAVLASVLMGVAVILAPLGVGPAGAHTDLLQASPGPGQQAGGTIDFVDLAFLESVSDAVVEVTLDGSPVAGTMVETDGVIIRYRIDEPLTVPGRYEVAYTITSLDQDRHTERYFFTYEPASPQAFRLGDASLASGQPDDGGWGASRVVTSIVLVAALAGLAFTYLSRVEKRRSRAAPGDQVTGR